MKFTAQQIADLLQGEIKGDPEAQVSQLSKIEEGVHESLSFLSNPKYTNYLYTTNASVVIVNKDFEPQKPISATLIRVTNASQAFAKLLEYYHAHKHSKTGIESPSFIADDVVLDKDAYIGAFSYLSKGVKIGTNPKIFPNVFIDENVTIGNDVVIYSGAKIYSDTQIGDRCIIHGNTIIGSDGFGFQPDENGVFQKVPQTGNVVLEDDIEVGSCTTIDRATLGSTIIRKGVKLDNQIQIAHNVEIGAHTAIAAQTGIAGSTKIGKHCLIGGQVGISGHLRIGDHVKIQAQSGVGRNIKDHEAIQGSPSIGYSDYNKSYVHFKNLPKIVNRINALEKK